jgi:hypothetical protein
MTITLINNTIVMCRDHHNRQLISHQGKFINVINNIKNSFKPEDVDWVLSNNGISKHVTFEEWTAAGYSGGPPVKTKSDSDVISLLPRP